MPLAKAMTRIYFWVMEDDTARPEGLKLEGFRQGEVLGKGVASCKLPILVNFQACRRHKSSLCYKTRHHWFESTYISYSM